MPYTLPHPPPQTYTTVNMQPQAYQTTQLSAPSSVVVTQQPAPVAQQTTIVQSTAPVVSQPNQAPPSQWSTSLLDCFQDIPSCCLGFCFPCCLACWIASRYNETCCLGWCGNVTLVALRTKIRADHRIQGSICDDCCCMCFLQPLVLCQMHRELNHKGYV